MFAWRSNVTGLYSMSHKGKQLYCYTVHVIHCTNKPNTRTLAHKHLTCLTALFSRVRLHKKLGHSTKRYSQTTVPKNYDTWWPFGPNCPNKKKIFANENAHHCLFAFLPRKLLRPSQEKAHTAHAHHPSYM